MEKIILLIDDDEDEYELFNMALLESELPFECLHASDALSALQMLNFIQPAFIFLDINMPRINGIKCLEEIKKISACRNVPVIMYSTGADDEMAKIVYALGADACIRKPAQAKVLAEVIRLIVYDCIDLNSVNTIIMSSYGALQKLPE